MNNIDVEEIVRQIDPTAKLDSDVVKLLKDFAFGKFFRSNNSA